MAHSHHHSPVRTEGEGASVRLGWAFFLNLGFTIIEFIGGVLTLSTAIMADAIHDLGDSLSIGSAWLLQKLGQREANAQFTYGFRRLSLLGALLNGMILVVGSVWILTEAIPRLFTPVAPHTEGMMLLAVLGAGVNGFAAWKLHGGQTLNEKVLNWHLLEDVLGWIAVFIISIVMYFTNWWILDPILSLAFTLFILINVSKHVWTTIQLFIQASPDQELQDKILNKLHELPEIKGCHHIHLWSLDGEHHVFTAHLEAAIESLQDYAELKAKVLQELGRFELAHTTIEIELSNEDCRDVTIMAKHNHKP